MYERGVYSLSENPKNILLWAHYADNHTGFCIEFNKKKGNWIDQHSKKVEYEKNYPVIKLVDMLLKQDENQLLKIVWTKSQKWSYEAEWRILTNKPGLYEYSSEIVSSIIFGYRMKSKNRDLIRNTLKFYKNIKFKEAKPLRNKYGLEITML